MEAGFLITAAFTNLAHRNKLTLAGLMGSEIDQLQSGEVFSTIGKLRKWSLGVLAKLKEGTSNEVKDTRSEYVKRFRSLPIKPASGCFFARARRPCEPASTHLSKIYKIETGEGISEYIARLRMDRACHKLVTTTKKVYEISLEIGYMDPAYFIKVFKRQFGVTPQEYRDQH